MAVANTSIYETDSISNVTPLQTNFAEELSDYGSDPVAAMTSYSRTMHQHTKQQMEAATKSARRRSIGNNNLVDAEASLTKEGSMSSVDSRGRE